MAIIKAEVIDRQRLTSREAEVLALVCQGEKDKVIARHLAISIKTVGAHLENIYRKMELREASINARCAAISCAVIRGMVRLSTPAICLMLMFGSLTLDNDHAARMGRTRLPSIRLVRKGESA